MQSILRVLSIAAATFSIAAMAEFNATENTDGQDPDAPDVGLALRATTDLGCFSNPGSMYNMGIYQFQSSGWCQALCVRQSKQYFANVNGTNCFCGDSPPDSQYKMSSDENCQSTCSGIDTKFCGGINYWEVYNSGFRNGDPTGTVSITVPSPTYTFMGPGASSTSSSTSQVATFVVTQAPTQSATQSAAASSGGGPNTAAIAAGVVVAIVLVAAIAGGIFFYLRRQKQHALAEEQRRHEMMTNFVTAEKPGSSYTSPDARLDPSLMFQRRLSDGSIRDNEDYTRRILKVANPDA